MGDPRPRHDWRDDSDRSAWRSDEEYERSAREDPLVWMKRPVDCSSFEVVDGPAPALRIAYTTAGTASGPNTGLAEVVVSEHREDEVIAVTIFERVVAGTLPTGHETSEKLAVAGGWVEVPLSDPYRGQRVIDGATGDPLERVQFGPDEAPRWRYSRGGCPRWLP